MISRDERERDRAICEAATPGPWEQMYASNNAGMPTADFKIPAHNGGATVEMLADDAAFIVAARERWPAALDALDEMERRIAEVEYRMRGMMASAERVRQLGAETHAKALVRAADGMREALRILRGEP